MTTQRSSLDDLRDEVLAAALPRVQFYGFSARLLSEAAQEAGANAAQLAALYPRGPVDMVVQYAADCDRQMADRMQAVDLAALKIRERAILAIRTRIDVAGQYKLAEKRAAAFLTFPLYAADAVQCLARTSDALWKAMGDQSADFSYYTRRMTMGAVYSACLLYWFTDESEGASDTQAFIERRIADVMQFEKLKAQASKAASGFPNPFALAGRLRYPRAR
ncbi:MAG TPA: COQ9 family protein [Alphaproteobacteria bacterium]|nr:COQ9 family protein [Alphaproteobacteria bacterium]HAJ47352.1 COQ9 family protein [Alphaproteobacteria bacterium]